MLSILNHVVGFVFGSMIILGSLVRHFYAEVLRSLIRIDGALWQALHATIARTRTYHMVFYVNMILVMLLLCYLCESSCILCVHPCPSSNHNL